MPVEAVLAVAAEFSEAEKWVSALLKAFSKVWGKRHFSLPQRSVPTSQSWVFKLLPPQKHHCETVQQGGVTFQTYLKNTAGDGTLLSHKQERSADIRHNTRTAKRIMPREGNPAQKVTYYIWFPLYETSRVGWSRERRQTSGHQSLGREGNEEWLLRGYRVPFGSTLG